MLPLNTKTSLEKLHIGNFIKDDREHDTLDARKIIFGNLAKNLCEVLGLKPFLVFGSAIIIILRIHART